MFQSANILPIPVLDSENLTADDTIRASAENMKLPFIHKHRRDELATSTQCSTRDGHKPGHGFSTSVTHSDIAHSANISQRDPENLTITITQTVFVDGTVTSTDNQGQSEITVTNTALLSSTDYVSITTTSTVFIFHASSTITASKTSIKPGATGNITQISVSTSSASHAVKVTGATLGSMAAVGLIGIFLWFCCWRKKSRRDKFKEQIRLKTVVTKIKQHRSNETNTPNLENQKQVDRGTLRQQALMEETRSVMLKQKSAIKALDMGNDSQAKLIGDAAKPGVSSTLSRPLSISAQQPLEMPAPLFSTAADSRSLSHSSSSIPSSQGPEPIPRKQLPFKPAPIITNTHHVGRQQRLSPLSPTAMMNAVSGAVRRLSPISGSRRDARGVDNRADGFEALLGADGRLKPQHKSSLRHGSHGIARSKSRKWI